MEPTPRGLARARAGLRRGLADEELADLLAPLPRRRRQGLLRTLRPFLVVRDGLIGFFHRKLTEFVADRFDAREIANYHARLCDLFRARCQTEWSYRRALEQLPSHLIGPDAGKN